MSPSRIRSLCLGLIACSLGLGCSGIRVNSDYDPETDLTKLGSFAWIESQATSHLVAGPGQPLLDKRVRRAVNDKLTEKGMKKVEAAEADFLIQYYVSVDTKLQVDTTNYGYGYGRYGYSRSGYRGGGYSETTVREYNEGTLLLDFVDPDRKELMWRGSGTTRLRSATTPEERELRVRAVVGRVLDQFPPSP